MTYADWQRKQIRGGERARMGRIPLTDTSLYLLHVIDRKTRSPIALPRVVHRVATLKDDEGAEVIIFQDHALGDQHAIRPDAPEIENVFVPLGAVRVMLQATNGGPT